MVSPADSSRILATLENSDLTGAALRRFAMEQLDTLDSYNWSGIYRLEGDMLVLDEYVGTATDHTHIPVGRGVCGTAVAERKNQVIEDVRELSNYLACSLHTQSELVVLIYRDSHQSPGSLESFSFSEASSDERSPTPSPRGSLALESDKVIIGQIDIDGHQVGAFDASDEELLTKMAAILAEKWE